MHIAGKVLLHIKQLPVCMAYILICQNPLSAVSQGGLELLSWTHCVYVSLQVNEVLEALLQQLQAHNNPHASAVQAAINLAGSSLHPHKAIRQVYPSPKNCTHLVPAAPVDCVSPSACCSLLGQLGKTCCCCLQCSFGCACDVVTAHVVWARQRFERCHSTDKSCHRGWKIAVVLCAAGVTVAMSCD